MKETICLMDLIYDVAIYRDEQIDNTILKSE